MYRSLEWGNALRASKLKLPYGDQAIFARRKLLEEIGIPQIPLMEDVELSKRLKLVARPYCISSVVITDSRRWEQGGVWPTIVLMWRLRWRYWRGGPWSC